MLPEIDGSLFCVVQYSFAEKTLGVLLNMLILKVFVRLQVDRVVLELQMSQNTSWSGEHVAPPDDKRNTALVCQQHCIESGDVAKTHGNA